MNGKIAERVSFKREAVEEECGECGGAKVSSKA